MLHDVCRVRHQIGRLTKTNRCPRFYVLKNMTSMTAIITEALNILIKPVLESSSSSVPSTAHDALLRKLQHNLSVSQEKFQTDPMYREVSSLRQQVKAGSEWSEETKDVAWNFVTEILVLLTCLKQCMAALLGSFSPAEPNLKTPEAAPALPPDVLSIAQQKVVQSALQFVVTLGICPYLLPGVGIPLKRRSEFGAMVESVSGGTPPYGIRRLFISCTVLLGVAEHASLGSMVLTRHLGDILAGLCQLGHCPNRSKAGQPTITDNTKILSVEERTGCKKALQSLLGKVYQPIIIRELLILQGGPKQVKASAGSCSRQPLAQAPPWLRRLCGQLLSERLMQPNGVQAVVRGILEGAGAGAAGGQDAEAAAADWRKCDSIARILASCPQQSLSLVDYYRRVCPQVLDLLHIRDRLTARQFQRVATTTVLTLVQEQPELAEKYLLAPLLSPLTRCLGTGDHKLSPGSITVEESDLSQCIEDIYKVCVVGNNPGPALLNSLGNVIQVIFCLFCFTKQNVSHLRSACQEILLWFLLQADPPQAVTALKHISGLSVQTEGISPDHHFSPGSEGGAVFTVREPTCDADDALYEKVSSEQWAVECFVDLLSNLKENRLSGDFFIHLLKGLTGMAVEGEQEGEEPQPLTSMSFLELEQHRIQQATRQEERLLTLQLLAAMCEKLSHTLLHNPVQVIEFICAMLKRACVSLDQGVEGIVEAQTLSMGMGLVATMLVGAAKLQSEDYAAMKELLPLLDQISQRHPEQLIQELASDLHISIATHGAFTTETVAKAARNTAGKEELIPERPSENTASKTTEKTKRRNSDKTPKKNPNVPGTAVTSQMDTAHCKNTGPVSHPVAQSSSRGGPHADPAEAGRLLSECLLEAVDPEVPTRAAALRTLTRMVQNRNAEALHNQDKLLTLFLENLEHSDSFVYLSAIQGLAVLSDVFPEQILLRLLKEFEESPKEMKKPHSLETRLKTGEALMRATRALGDLAPRFGTPLIHAFLRGTRDSDSTVRASSLSNLGELCQRLHFALGAVVHELSSCLTALIKTDSEAEVRRAAVHVIALLLRGLSDNATQVLSDVLRDLYRVLKHVVQHDRDDVTVLHAQLALEELDDVMRRYIFPAQKLEKKIVVLP
ncbi:transport and Golgi organization protein 6 homolog isoform X3 [Acipenser ruthenus]|uniref:transport and Golgi organization protein 6 homolog isoform X3 n=1 Tax=Acipenser ruthenus TaxID=7906 RepID=UPI0027410123|nr:transport and Golgi organization protein 6 homolog isoform X3 [Acipenser ruthenus]